MKPIKRTTIMGIMGVITFLLIVLSAFLATDGDKINEAAMFVSGTVLISLYFIASIFIILKYPAHESKVHDGFDIEKVHVARTKEGNIIEAVSGLMVIIAWVIALATRRFINAEGGINYFQIFTWVILTFCVMLSLVQVYKPGAIVGMGELTNMKQVNLAIKLSRIMALILALVCLCSAIFGQAISHFFLEKMALYMLLLFTIIAHILTNKLK